MIKDWTGGNSGFYSVNHRKKEIEVEEYDFYCTHPESIKLFLKAAKNTNLIIPNNILEPCCGIGSISKILKENGYSVYSSDLIDRGYGEETGIDFLKTNKWDNQFDCIFTNPPYRYAVEITEKAIKTVTIASKPYAFGSNIRARTMDTMIDNPRLANNSTNFQLVAFAY